MAPSFGHMTDGSSPRFLQGAFEFEGSGYEKPTPLDDSLRYVVPAGAIPPSRCTSAAATRPNRWSRSCCSGKGVTNVALRVVEGLLAGTVLELYVAAHGGTKGSVVVDLGLVEF